MPTLIKRCVALGPKWYSKREEPGFKSRFVMPMHLTTSFTAFFLIKAKSQKVREVTAEVFRACADLALCYETGTSSRETYNS